MKRIILTTATLLLIIIAGCKSGTTGNPKEVLNKFFSALSKKDFDGAKKFATKDSDGMISMMQMGMQHMQGMNNSHSDKMLEMINNMNMGDAVINGDTATVTVTDKKSNESTDFLLKKENGDWKVAFDMSTLMEMANKKMKEQGSGNMGNSDSGISHNSVDSTMKNVPQSPQMPDTAKHVK
ncbi:MAG: DUF4878 domain-containing protein [Ginsengibacter sp.]